LYTLHVLSAFGVPTAAYPHPYHPAAAEMSAQKLDMLDEMPCSL
jgi:hypothetical protein